MSVVIDQLTAFPYTSTNKATLHTTGGSVIVARRTGGSGPFQIGHTGSGEKNHQLKIEGTNGEGIWDGVILELEPGDDHRAKVQCTARSRGGLFQKLLSFFQKPPAPRQPLDGQVTVTVRLCTVAGIREQCIDDGPTSDPISVLFEA